MIVYLAVIFSVFFLAQNAVKEYSPELKQKSGQSNKLNIAPVVFIILILSICAGIRNYVGTDFSTYKGLFNYYSKAPLLDTIKEDEGIFWAVSGLIGRLTGNVTYVFLFFAFAVSICDVLTLFKHTINAQLSVFLYIATMQYFLAFNGIRQSMAASVMFAALPLLINKKWFKYLLVVLCMYFVHNSVILIVPFAIVANMNPRRRLTKWIFIISFCIIFLFPNFVDSLFSFLTPENYQHFLDNENDDGVNILRVLVALIPVAISWIFYDSLYEQAENKRLFELLVNFSTINLMILVLALRSTVMARFTFYTGIYNVLLIPYFIGIFKERERTLATVIIMMLFLLYMIMLLPNESSLLPYRTVFGG